MLGGGLLAMAIAATRVVLPYDEMLAGLTREEMVQLNPRLLPFMQHDRVTLAGTMLAIGVLYMTLAYWGIRRGVHWAYLAVVVSAFAGFFSFFSFLGFGYFDPFHAFVTAILFQFLLLAMHAHLPARHDLEPPGLWNDRRWQANHWGQLLFVIQGACAAGGGADHLDHRHDQRVRAGGFGIHADLRRGAVRRPSAAGAVGGARSGDVRRHAHGVRHRDVAAGGVGFWPRAGVAVVVADDGGHAGVLRDHAGALGGGVPQSEASAASGGRIDAAVGGRGAKLRLSRGA